MPEYLHGRPVLKIAMEAQSEHPLQPVLRQRFQLLLCVLRSQLSADGRPPYLTNDCIRGGFQKHADIEGQEQKRRLDEKMSTTQTDGGLREAEAAVAALIS